MKLGKRAPRYTRKLMRSAITMAQHLDALGPAPLASNDYLSAVTVPWQVFGNDQYGDCVQCDTAHSLMLRTANASSIIVPTEADVLALYTAMTGFNPADRSTDQGTDELTMCQYMQSTGFLGHKADAIGTVDPLTTDHLKWCVQLFGSCRIGLNFPAFAMDQFNAGQPWDVGPTNDSIEGGHDVPLLGYDANFYYAVTWGQVQKITPKFLTTFADEAHSEIDADWIKEQGIAPSGFSLAALVAELGEIGT